MAYRGESLRETDLNLDFAHETRDSWMTAEPAGCVLGFELNQLSAQYIDLSRLSDPIGLQFSYNLSPEKKDFVPKQVLSNGVLEPCPIPSRMPHVWRLPFQDIPPTPNLIPGQDGEAMFLRFAFGSGFNPEKLAAMNPNMLMRALERAGKDLTERVRPLLPTHLGLDFRLIPMMGPEKRVSIEVRDAHSGDTPFALRGTGLRRLLSLVVGLSEADFREEQHLILFDEPEYALHADSQRLIRSVLERLADLPSVQVIYATHSPAMINPFRASGVRVLRRASADGHATTKVEAKAFLENFRPVRQELGMLASDSLLFAPVTVVVEGPTEQVCVPQAVVRLELEGVEGFSGASELLGQIAILQGFGDSIEYLVRLVEAQGFKAFVFLDGDKRYSTLTTKLANLHPAAKVITFPEGTEFEEIVPPEVYVEAVAKWAERFGLNEKTVSYESFLDYEKRPEIRRRMFTKRVESWFEDLSAGCSLDKPSVMKLAIEICPIGSLRTVEFALLLNAVKVP
jgi:hypothetical protein